MTIHEGTGQIAALLLRLLEAPYTSDWWEANHALVHQGPRIVPDLTIMVEKGPSFAVAAAARILGHMGHRAQSAAPALLDQLASPDEKVRSEAAHALAQINPKLKYAVPILSQRLEVEDSMAVRRSLLRILGNVGPSANACVPAIQEVLVDDYLFEDAVCALQSITRGGEPPVEVLIDRLRSTHTYVACAAARALGRTGNCKDAVHAALVSASQGSDWTLEDEARKALRRLGYVMRDPEEEEE